MADEEEEEDCELIREDNLPFKEINSNVLLPFCEFFFTWTKSLRSFGTHEKTRARCFQNRI